MKVCLFSLQIKYKGNVKTEISSSLYSLLPETTETQFVKELTEILSEVRLDGWMINERMDELYISLNVSKLSLLLRTSTRRRGRRS